MALPTGLRILAVQNGVGVGHILTIPVDVDQESGETVVVLPCGSTGTIVGNPFWDMGPVIDISDSKGGTWSISTLGGEWNIGTIRTDFGSGSDKGNILFGPSGRRTGGALLEAGDSIVVEWQDVGTTLDGTAAAVLGIMGGLGAVETELGEGVQYVGIARSQGNATLLYVDEAWTPTAYVGTTPPILEGFSISVGIDQDGEVVPAEGDNIVGIDAGTFTLLIWGVYNLTDEQTFEPGASASSELGMVNFQFGSTTLGSGSPTIEEGEPIRFGESGPWRFLVTDLDTVTLALLDRLARNRQITFTLNQPCHMVGTVPSDNPEVNLLAGDDMPLLAEGARLLYCFRRENDVATSDAPIWVIRAAGIILNVVDDGGPDGEETAFEAFDPWQLLYRRPLRDETGNLPGQNGLTFSAAGSAIAEQIIAFSELVDGTTHLDLLTGTIETTDVVDVNFQQGISVGEALDTLVDTGTMDIIIEPVYDPIGKPGIVGQLNIYETAGSVRRDSPFAWDKPGRGLVDLNRQTDGRERANKLQYYVGQGGPPVSLVTDASSVSEFGTYWEQQFFPGDEEADVVLGFAQRQKLLRRRGLITYQISPAPERAPVPITGYYIGDYVPIYGSRRLREEVATLKRVMSIPLLIGDDQMEAPASVIVADDEQPG